MGLEMARPGRKRKQRGHLMGRDVPDPGRALVGQQPHRAWLPADMRLAEKAATPLGALNLIGVITDRQYEAGQRYIVVVAEFLAMAGGPKDNFSAGKGYRCLGETGCNPCECQRREIEYAAAESRLKDAGRSSYVIVRHVVVDGQECPPFQRQALKCGLDGLVRHFGLDSQSKKMHGRNM